MDGKEIIISKLKYKIIKKNILESGDFSINPVEFTNCEIEISDINIEKEDAGSNGNISASEDVKSVILKKEFDGKWCVGDAATYVDIDIERCLRHMFLDETSVVTITYLDKHENAAMSISCKIKMVKIGDVELFCDWHWAKKVTQAKRHKEMGKNLAINNQVIESFRKFSKSLKFLISIDKNDLEGVDENNLKEIKNLKVDLYNNLAFCQLQYNEYQAVVDLCNKALEINKRSKKALYRRGSARMGLADWEAAYSDICQVISLDPNNAAAKSKATELREKVIHMNEAYKKVIKNMFV